MNNLRIAIDGGAATGKSTIAKMVANKLKIKYINTGQMYRLFAFIVIKNDILDNEEEIFKLIKNIKVFYDNSGNIKTNFIKFRINELNDLKVAKIASKISIMPKVRQVITNLQIEIGKNFGILMEGRDIGTIIMKDADFKFFLKVEPKEAAHRRYKQLVKQGIKANEQEILKSIINRNKRDENRLIAPLVPSKDSIIIDTTNINIQETCKKILEVINNG